MSELQVYNYEHQLKAYIVQFAAVFANLQVKIGRRDGTEPQLISVPIKNASQDRVVGSIKGNNTQNKPIRLPLMSYQLLGLELDPNLRKGLGASRRSSVMPTGGLYPDDFKVVQQRMPVPYRANFELSIWASNQDQHYQIVEQILTLFDPLIQLQVSDDVFDWTRITTLELTDIRFDETVPMGTDKRTIQTSMSFSVVVHLSMPADVRNNVINDIFIRIGAVSQDVNTALEILEDLDGQGITYDNVFSASDVDIDK